MRNTKKQKNRDTFISTNSYKILKKRSRRYTKNKQLNAETETNKIRIRYWMKEEEEKEIRYRMCKIEKETLQHILIENPCTMDEAKKEKKQY